MIFVKLGLRGSWCSVPITLGKGLKPAGSWAWLLETQRLGLWGWDSCPPYAPKRHQTTPEHSCLRFFFKIWVKSWYYRAYTCSTALHWGV